MTAPAVHGVMTGVLEREHGARLNSFDLVTPDGQPVRWALSLLHDAALTDRVYGPILTLHVLHAAAGESLPWERTHTRDEWLEKPTKLTYNPYTPLRVS